MRALRPLLDAHVSGHLALHYLNQLPRKGKVSRNITEVLRCTSRAEALPQRQTLQQMKRGTKSYMRDNLQGFSHHMADAANGAPAIWPQRLQLWSASSE